MTRSPSSKAPSGTSRSGSLHVRRPGGALLAAAALLATGAGALAQSPGGSTGPAAGSPAGFPVELVDDEGTVLTIEARPERVISLSPANTEIVFALGAGDRLVGGTDYDDYPPEAAALPDVATYSGVVAEQAVALEPDLVLARGNGDERSPDAQRLRDLGLPVLVLYAETVDGILADIELVGDALGEGGRARDLTAAIRARADQVAAAAAAVGTRPRTFYQVGSGEDGVYGPAKDSFVADMVSLAGGEPITTGDASDWTMPVERLVAADPEVIVLGDALYGVCPADVMARPGWGVMTAVRDGAVRPVNDIPITRPGPRIADGLASLARAIHPGIDLAGVPEDAPLCATAGIAGGALALR